MNRKDEIIAIYSSHRPMMRTVACRMLGSEIDADDAVQCAFIDALNKAATFKGDAKLATWVTKILINECRERLRMRRAKCRQNVIELTDEIAATLSKDAASHVDLETLEAETAVQVALTRLPAIYQPPIRAYYYDNKTAKQIASDMGLTVGAVKSRIFRGMLRLRAMSVIQAVAR